MLNKDFQQRLVIVAVCLLLATLVALLNFSIYVTADLAEWKQVDYWKVLVQEITGAYSVLCLFPALLWVMMRYTVDSSNWRLRLPLHLLFSIVFGTSHTLLMWGSRLLLFPLLGWGEYNYGRLAYRFPMEYGRQLLVYGFMFAIVSAVLHARQKRSQELRASTLEKKLTEARLETLKMQLNPHFLFNTLNMISSYVYEDPATADRMIVRLSDLLRLTLNQADGQEIKLEKELKLLDCYLSIMKMRFQEQLQVQLAIDPSTRQCLVPFLILQPLVENSIKHCTAAINTPGVIRISSTSQEGRLCLTIEDQGPGLQELGPAAENPPGGGIGLVNTRQRLDQLYGSAYQLQLTNLPGGGLQVMMDLPWRLSSLRNGVEP